MKPHVLFATGDTAVSRRLQPEVADVCSMKVTVSSGQAYTALRREQFDLVVLDVKLPRLDSFELVRALYHAATPQGTLVSWGPLKDAVYIVGMGNWEAVTVRRTYGQLVETLRSLLDPAAARTIETVRYQSKEDTFFVAFRNGKAYELARRAVEVDDESPVIRQPRVVHGGAAFEVQQESRNTYEVPWDLVLYHREPSYPYHKGSSSQREAEANRAERIGTRIRQEREARGWSLAELSRRTGIQPPNLSRVESGKHTPSLDTIERVADALGVRVADLVAA